MRLPASRADRRADFLAGTAAFKAVLLEGVEVVFIVIATGARPGMLPYASLGALIACIAVLVIGLLVHKPLSSVPENTLKFIVGLLLTAFGIFWMGEGIGTPWPGEDLSLLRNLRPARRLLLHRSPVAAAISRYACGARPMNILRIAVKELIGMFIDDGALALFSLLLVLAVGLAVETTARSARSAGAVLLVAGCLAILAESVTRAARRKFRQ